MANHGVFVSENKTAVQTPITVPTGIPYFVGLAPIQMAEKPATPNVPVLCRSWDEAVAALGYSDDWAHYTLCEAMDSHFKRYGMSPAIFCNVLDPATMNESVAAQDVAVTDHRVELPGEAINGDGLEVKKQGSEEEAYTKGKDYTVFYDNGKAYVELLAGEHFTEAQLNIAYKKVKFDSCTKENVTKGIESVELCMNLLGVVPDLLLAPGYSEQTEVAAALAAKAALINGLFRAKAIVDISTDHTSGAETYDKVLEKKKAGYTDLNMIACWPMVALGGKVYHMSTHIAGVIASVDNEYGAPCYSPSNHDIKIDSLVTKAGAAVLLTLAQANELNANGVTTALNFMGGFKCWGNYTACYPTNTDVKDYFAPVSRMFDWVANTLIQRFWSQLDLPMTRRFADSIVDAANIWLNGLTGSGYLLGGRVEMIESENPVTNLMQGIVKFHVHLTPPSPAQEIDFALEYDVSILEAAFA